MASNRLDEIEKNVAEIARRLDVPARYLPTFGFTEDFGRPHIEVDDKGYHYIVVERGVVRDARIVDNIKDLLYLIFVSATSSMAWDFERLNRIQGQDARRLAFKKQLQLLNEIDKDFGKRYAKELISILANAPYADDIDT